MASFTAKHLQKPENWWRLLIMLLYSVVIYFVLSLSIIAIGLFQFVHMLLLGTTNSGVQKFSQSLCDFYSQSMTFITYNSDRKPFPFDQWPSA